MGADPVAGDVMRRPPRRSTERVINALMWRGVLFNGLTMALLTLLTLDVMLPGGWVDGDHTLAQARTAAFTVLVLAQLFNAFNARSETDSALRGLWANGWLWGAVLLSAALQVAVVHLPWLNTAFSAVPLSLADWALCLVMASGVMACSELRKLLLRQLAPQASSAARATPAPHAQPLA
jgi:magnesium-transporting ATPase (P-type)